MIECIQCEEDASLNWVPYGSESFLCAACAVVKVVDYVE
jgi:hypothetical protein